MESKCVNKLPAICHVMLPAGPRPVPMQTKNRKGQWEWEGAGHTSLCFGRDGRGKVEEGSLPA